jgi:hypothetical protein
MIPTELLRRIGRKAMRTLRPQPPTTPQHSSPAAAPAASAPAQQAHRPPVFAKYTEPGELSELGILFMPLAEYHGKELAAIAGELVALGHLCSFLVEESLVEVVDEHLGDHLRVLAMAGYDKHALGEFKAFVAMNDWGEPSRNMYHLARVRGVPSFAKVEGVQDFTDVDTGRIRLPYLAADHVLVQGTNDTESLDRANLHVVGNANMEHAWNEGPTSAPRNGEVVINSNFTYGVLTEVRDDFLRSAIEAIQQVGLTPVISQHPADRALPAELKQYRTDRSMSSMLPTCEAVVTRFSTVPFEAIAYGTPFVYFNPHHEKVPTFATPSPAFEHVHSGDDLREALRRCIDDRTGYRTRAESYFRAQIEMAETPSAARTASAIAAVLASTP